MSEKDQFHNIIKAKIGEIRCDIEKLKAVDSLIGKDATENKKNELISIIFVLQDVRSTLIDEESRERSRNSLMESLK